ncbi:hypothetical protein [Vibrio vulnificus]|uniref:hypothetical protein n=1 Tax=Vibrio vulnificus TaxID=672 RepID=UPI003242FD29
MNLVGKLIGTVMFFGITSLAQLAIAQEDTQRGSELRSGQQSYEEREITFKNRKWRLNKGKESGLYICSGDDPDIRYRYNRAGAFCQKTSTGWKYILGLMDDVEEIKLEDYLHEVTGQYVEVVRTSFDNNDLTVTYVIDASISMPEPARASDAVEGKLDAEFTWFGWLERSANTLDSIFFQVVASFFIAVGVVSRLMNRGNTFTLLSYICMGLLLLGFPIIVRIASSYPVALIALPVHIALTAWCTYLDKRQRTDGVLSWERQRLFVGSSPLTRPVAESSRMNRLPELNELREKKESLSESDPKLEVPVKKNKRKVILE